MHYAVTPTIDPFSGGQTLIYTIEVLNRPLPLYLLRSRIWSSEVPRLQGPGWPRRQPPPGLRGQVRGAPAAPCGPSDQCFRDCPWGRAVRPFQAFQGCHSVPVGHLSLQVEIRFDSLANLLNESTCNAIKSATLWCNTVRTLERHRRKQSKSHTV